MEEEKEEEVTLADVNAKLDILIGALQKVAKRFPLMGLKV